MSENQDEEATARLEPTALEGAGPTTGVQGRGTAPSGHEQPYAGPGDTARAGADPADASGTDVGPTEASTPGEEDGDPRPGSAG
jgi:hypothetical protein